MYSEAQAAEIAKYKMAYGHPRYRMGDARKAAALAEMAGLPSPWRGRYLDVACGRGEMLDTALNLGFAEAQGTEVVPDLLGERVTYAVAWDLPFEDDSFDVVTLFDVIEHILPGDDEKVCRELARVARRCVLLTANNHPSNSLGVELHVNRRPYEEWDGLFKTWFPGRVTWRPAGGSPSETWRVDL